MAMSRFLFLIGFEPVVVHDAGSPARLDEAGGAPVRRA
jgi:hypothetical protein